jgi:thiopeptide-type bacteriocin biosynthesis protein
MVRESRLYFGKDPFVVGRVPTFPSSSALELFNAHDIADFLKTVWQGSPIFGAAVFVASPSLYEEAAKQFAESRLDWRAAKSMAAYYLRMSTRPTPFGLFAGIGLITVGPTSTLKLADEERMRTFTQVDIEWLRALNSSLESSSEARSLICVATNELLIEQGDRIHIMHPEKAAAREAPESLRYASISIRKSALVDEVKTECRSGVKLHDLIARVSERHALEHERAAAVVEKLWNSGLLISELHFSPTNEPFERTRQTLRRLAPAVEASLGAVESSLRTLDRVPPLHRTGADYKAVSEAIKAVHATDGNRLHVDLGVGFEGHLGMNVLDELKTLAGYLLRTHPSVSQTAYIERFLARYEGSERMIPVVELADDDFGIGSPELKPERKSDGRELDLRELLLFEIAQKATQDRTIEVELDDKSVQKVLLSDPPDRELPNSIEVSCQICARDLDGLNSGNFRICPSGFFGSSGAGKSTGRFAGILGKGAIERLKPIWRDSQPQNVVTAELSYEPFSTKLSNVVLRPNIADFEVQVGFVDNSIASRRLGVNDLYIGFDGERLFVWSKSLAAEVEIVETHMLNTISSALNVSRLLAFVSMAGKRWVGPFSWGAVGNGIFTPRLRVERIILTPARWRLPTRIADADSAEKWKTSIRLWKEEWFVPKYVAAVVADTRLLVDTETDLGLTLLHDAARKARNQNMIVEEYFPFRDHWLKRGSRSFSLEIVASIGVRKRAQTRKRSPTILNDKHRIKGIRSDWVSAHLYCGKNQMDAILTDVVVPFLSPFKLRGEVDDWFFVRYADVADHLRVRFHMAERDARDKRKILEESLDEACTRSEIRRLSVTTYERELERYGGEAVMGLIERLFTIDSEVVIGSLRIRPFGIQRIEACVATFGWLMGSLDRETQTRWIDHHRPIRHVKLAGDHWDAIRRLKQQERADNHDTFGEVKAILYELERRDRRGELAASLVDILRSLMHMHCNRFGLSSEQEQLAQHYQWQVYYGLSSQRPNT